MLIRSQSKQSIVNLDNIDTVTVCSDGEIYTFNGCEKTRIAKYSTEEKAIKVLDMIQKKYLETTEICQGDYAIRYVPRATVFQMPQDKNVEVE